MNGHSTGLLFDLLMLLALLAALVLWWAANQRGYRGRIAQRVRALSGAQIASAAASDAGEEEAPGLRQRLIGQLVSLGERMPLFTVEHRLKLHHDLGLAGFRGRNAVAAFIGMKFVVGIACAVLVVMGGADLIAAGHNPVVRILMMLAAFMVGMIVPEYILGFYSRQRQKTIVAYLPDALDLFVICTNAGNSLGVSIQRVAREMGPICPPLAAELTQTADELHLSGDGVRALQGLAERVDAPSVRALISTLTQSMRYGTLITHALRTLSRIERTAHMVRLEESAAKLAPKMVVPMMIFILPAVCAISAGPTIIQLVSMLKSL